MCLCCRRSWKDVNRISKWCWKNLYKTRRTTQFSKRGERFVVVFPYSRKIENLEKYNHIQRWSIRYEMGREYVLDSTKNTASMFVEKKARFFEKFSDIGENQPCILYWIRRVECFLVLRMEYFHLFLGGAGSWIQIYKDLHRSKI